MQYKHNEWEAKWAMVVSLARMLQSFGQAQNDLPTLAAENAQRASISQDAEVKEAGATEKVIK